MTPSENTWPQVAVVVGGYLLAIYVQNRKLARLAKRIDDIRIEMNSHFVALSSDLRNLLD